MVDLDPEDYGEILNWFTHTYGKTMTMKELDGQPLRTFWKLKFLAEDKIREFKEEME